MATLSSCKGPLTALAVSALVSACGGSSEPPQAPATEPAAAAPAPAPTEAVASPSAAAPAVPAAPEPAPSTAPTEAPATPPTDAAPGGTAEISDVHVTGGTMEDAPRVVEGMRMGFRNCYAKGLTAKADAEGDVTVTIRVGAAGQVLGVTTQRTTLIPQTVVTCITGRAGAASFAPPTGTKKKVDVTVGFKVTMKPH